METDIELGDRTLLGLMAAAIFSTGQFSPKESAAKAIQLLGWVETPAEMEREKGDPDDVPF